MFMQDIFSLGCVIAELFLEGQRLFDLSEVGYLQSPCGQGRIWPCFCSMEGDDEWCAVQLLAYKRGEFSPEVTLAKVRCNHFIFF